MKKLNYLLALIVVFLSSCATYNYQSTSSDEAFTKVYCKSPEYVGTLTVLVGSNNGKYFINRTAVSYGAITVIDTVYLKFTPLDLTISNLTLEAQSKYGKDVTVSNIRWDIETSTAFFFFTSVQKVGATYDVIKCK